MLKYRCDLTAIHLYLIKDANLILYILSRMLIELLTLYKQFQE